MQIVGVNINALGDLGNRAKEFIETLRLNLCQPQDRLFVDSLSVIELDSSRLAVVREVINRRANTFLQSLEQELASEGAILVGSRRRKLAKLSLTVFETRR